MIERSQRKLVQVGVAPSIPRYARHNPTRSTSTQSRPFHSEQTRSQIQLIDTITNAITTPTPNTIMADNNWMWFGEVGDLWDDEQPEMNAAARAYMAANDGEVPVPALVSQDLAQYLGLMVDDRDNGNGADDNMLAGIHLDFDVDVTEIEPKSSAPKGKENEAPVSHLDDNNPEASNMAMVKMEESSDEDIMKKGNRDTMFETEESSEEEFVKKGNRDTMRSFRKLTRGQKKMREEAKREKLEQKENSKGPLRRRLTDANKATQKRARKELLEDGDGLPRAKRVATLRSRRQAQVGRRSPPTGH